MSSKFSQFQEWKAFEEFEEFEKIQPISPPQHLSDTIASCVKTDLHPSAVRVFAKLSGIHLLVAMVTLALCPQFGLSPWAHGHGLMRYFMNLGDYGCIIACGFFFLGSSLVIAAWGLRPEEVRVIRKNGLTQFTSLALLSLGFFIMFDAQILGIYALLWLLGSLGGAVVATEIVWAFRARLMLDKINRT